MFVEVVVHRPTFRRPPVGADPVRDDATFERTYTYRLPERLRGALAIGHLVQVPLQASMALGVVVDLPDDLPPGLQPEALRDVAELLDPVPVVTPSQIDLARWIAGSCLVPLSQAMRLMLPPGLEDRTLRVVGQKGAVSDAGLSADESRALRWLQNHAGQARLSGLLGQLRAADPEAVIQSLVERGLVEAHYAFVPPRAAPPRVHYVGLLADESTIHAALPHLGRPSKRADLLLALAGRSDSLVSLQDLCQRVGCTPAPVLALEERGWVQITKPRTLVVALPPHADGPPPDLSTPKQAAVWAALRDQGVPVDLGGFLSRSGFSVGAISELEKKGWVHRVKEPAWVLLTLPRDQVMDRVLELRGGIGERAVLEAMRGAVGRVWVGGLYAETGADLSVLHRLAERGLISLHSDAHDRPPLVPQEEPRRLTPDQDRVWEQVKRGLECAGHGEAPWVALLHGVTGSGKTEIYLAAIEHVLAAGQRAIVLVPEISLTAQTVRRFEARFAGRVAVLHSQLSLGQRYDVWERVRHGEAAVLVGPRSALFAPMSRLGLIVVDEAHDGSYKQEEPIPLPAYHACDVAVEQGRRAGAAVLFGTATPDVVMYYRATRGAFRLLELPQRVVTPRASCPQPPHPAPEPSIAALPPVRLVDLRQELRAGNRSIFSRALQEALHRTLEAGEQAILFLNRRGAATFVLCRDCGYVARCPKCDIPLTYHQHGREAGVSVRDRSSPQRFEGLICHRCNYRGPAPAVCSACGGKHIRYFGLGTERVEAELREIYPEARLLRWDHDTAAGPDHERLLQTFAEHRADVLVGTQMIAKGLDLPLVTLVGVISADTALNLPDFHAAERTFQLVTQVAGRAGRSQRGGQVIVQTYHPNHYAIRAAAGHDYAGFYRQELAYRAQLGYPPFSRLVALRFSDPDPQLCQAEAERLAHWVSAELRRLHLPGDLIGPAPCFFARIQGRSRWQIVIRAPDPMPLLRNVALPWGWRADVEPTSLL